MSEALPPKKNKYIINNSGMPLTKVVYEFAINLRKKKLDNFSGVKIKANKKPITIAVMETAIVINVAKNNSSPQPVEPKCKYSKKKRRLLQPPNQIVFT